MNSPTSFVDVPSVVDRIDRARDPSTWCNMVVGHAVFGDRLSKCSDAFGKLKAATQRLASAKVIMEDLKARGDSDMPIPEDVRMQDILSANSTMELENKIRSHAERDAKFKKVDDELKVAQHEFDVCSEEVKRTYEALVKTCAA